MKELDLLYEAFQKGLRIIKKYHHSWDDEIILAADAEITHLEKNEKGNLNFYVANDLNWCRCGCKTIKDLRKDNLDELCDEEEGCVCNFALGGEIQPKDLHEGKIFIMLPLMPNIEKLPVIMKK